MELTPQEIASEYQRRLGLEFETFRDQIRLIVQPEQIEEVIRTLRDEFGFNFLSDFSVVDYWPQEEPRFHAIYQLRRVPQATHIMIRVPLNGNSPHLPTMEKIFPNANWFEREVWDLFGIYFDGHSDLRRIVMPQDWEGHPLRKDYPLGYEEVQYTFNVDDIQMRKPSPKE